MLEELPSSLPSLRQAFSKSIREASSEEEDLGGWFCFTTVTDASFS